MNSRAARFLTKLYPQSWRARFGAEFQTFLETRRVSPSEVLDIAGRAFIEHLEETWRAALRAIAFACVVTVAVRYSFNLGIGERPQPEAWLGWGGLFGTAAAIFVPMLPASRPVLRAMLRSPWVLGYKLLVLVYCARILWHGPWHLGAGLATILIGTFWKEVARGLAASIDGWRMAISIVATVSLVSAGLGLMLRGSFESNDVWLPWVFSLLAVADTVRSERRIFAGQ